MSKIFRYMWAFLGLGAALFGALFGCSGEPIKPFTDATFRLDSPTLSACKKLNKKESCTATLAGVIDQRGVSEPGEGVADCTQCVFNQKFTIIDGKGGRHIFYYKLPDNGVIPVNLEEGVRMTYIEADRIGQGYAMSLRDGKDNLIAAIASGPGGQMLIDQKLLGQVNVTTVRDKEAGQEQTECGTKVYRSLSLTVAGQSIQVVPGKTKELTGNPTYRLTNINRFSWQNSTCASRTTPYAFVLYRTASSN